MEHKIKFVNPDAFSKAINDVNSGESIHNYIRAENFEIQAWEMEPPNGYQPSENKATGEELPNCCHFHKQVFEATAKYMEKFPDCCEVHRKLLQAPWFLKDNYKDIPLKVVKQLSYTEYLIVSKIDTTDWYDDITDYIEANISSFGHLPQGYGSPVGLDKYLTCLKYHIDNTTHDISSEKRRRLIEYIDYNYTPKETRVSDLNVLVATYKDWVHIFPFQLSYFKDLKPYFESRLPILTGEPQFNRYSGISRTKIHTKMSLIEFLIQTTNDLLCHINGLTLYKEGNITDPKSMQLELALESRKQELDKGYINNSVDEEQRFRKILKKWLKDEKKFFMEITPLVNSLAEVKNIKAPSSYDITDIKPIIKKEAIPQIYGLLRDFFSPEDQPKLKRLLMTGKSVPSPLLFMDHGNRLADAFKQLYNSDIITGCQKYELEEWIRKNFNFRHNNKANAFTPYYLRDIISTTKDKCQNPILNVKMNKETCEYIIIKA